MASEKGPQVPVLYSNSYTSIGVTQGNLISSQEGVSSLHVIVVTRA